MVASDNTPWRLGFSLKTLPGSASFQIKSHWMVEEELVKPAKDMEDVELVERDLLKVTKVCGELDLSMKEEMVEFLKKNLDIFSWIHEDMPSIDNKVIEHRLNDDLTKKPIQQKRRVFAPERNKVVIEEVEKLLTAGFIQEVFYP